MPRYSQYNVPTKNIMVNSKDFNIENLKLGNTFKVNEDVFVQDFSCTPKTESFACLSDPRPKTPISQSYNYTKKPEVFFWKLSEPE